MKAIKILLLMTVLTSTNIYGVEGLGDIIPPDDIKDFKIDLNDFFKSRKNIKDAYYVTGGYISCGSLSGSRKLLKYSLESEEISQRRLRFINCTHLSEGGVGRIYKTVGDFSFMQISELYTDRDTGNYLYRTVWVHNSYLVKYSEHKKQTDLIKSRNNIK